VSPVRTTLAALAASGLALLTVGSTAPAFAADAVNGGFADAYGLSIDTTLLQGNIPVAVGPLAESANSCPPTADPASASVVGGGDPQVAMVDVLTSGTGAECSTPKTLAKAQVTNVQALQVAAPIQLHADAITSTSSSNCTAAPTGSTQIVNLTIGGTAIPLPTDVPPNTKVAEPLLAPFGITIIANEQHPDASGRGLVVNGLHIIGSANGAALPVGGSVLRGDVVIAHASSGVVCANGAGTTEKKPEISFTKTADPTTAKPGTRVTYTANVTNSSTTACEVLRFVDHISPAFTLASTAGPFGTTYDQPVPTRGGDGGQEAVLRPAALTIAPGKTVTQTFVVTVKADAKPGTYYNNLELFCGPDGDFASGPLAPVTVPAPVVAPVVAPVTAPTVAPAQLPRTGPSPLIAGGAVLFLIGAAGVRRATR
jgi:uncharacterized repeat protein (TIGR01451 family)